MSRILPILFNTDMVKAILDGRKTATRRLIKPQPYGFFEANESPAYLYDFDPIRERIYPQYQMGDILYVRETVWQKASGTLGMDGETETALWNEFKYVATDEKPQTGWNYSWIKRPSIHMPKEAARIWLEVADVRVERLQDIDEDGVWNEGFRFTPPCLTRVSADGHACDLDGPCTSSIKYCDMTMGELFGRELWDSTVKKSDLDRYGWNANPWVWVYEFERCEKPD